MGVFVPQNAQPALAMLEIMDFDGKEKVKQYVAQGQTLQNIVEQQQQIIMQLQQQLGMVQNTPYSPQTGEQQNPQVGYSNTAQDNAMRSQNYTETLLKKASAMQ